MKHILFVVWMLFPGLFFAGVLMGEIGFADELQNALPASLQLWWIPVAIISIGGLVLIEWINGWRTNLFIATKYFGLILAEAGIVSWISLQILGISSIPLYLWLVFGVGVGLYTGVDWFYKPRH